MVESFLRAQSCWLTFSPVAVAAHRGSRKGQRGIACVHSLMCHLGLSGSWDDITEREAKRHLERAVLGRSVVCRGGRAVGLCLPLGTVGRIVKVPLQLAVIT